MIMYVIRKCATVYENQLFYTDDNSQAIQESLAKEVPDEPPQGCTEVTCALRIRTPDRNMLTRKFYGKNRLQAVLNYITSKGFHLTEYKLLTTYPRRDVSMRWFDFFQFDVMSLSYVFLQCFIMFSKQLTTDFDPIKPNKVDETPLWKGMYFNTLLAFQSIDFITTSYYNYNKLLICNPC